MILIDDDHRTIEARFNHYPDATGHRNGHVWRGLTECSLTRKAKTEDLFSEQHVEFARCSELDSFEKRVGRKIAFHRALHRMFPGPAYREFRGALWEVYFSKTGGKR